MKFYKHILYKKDSSAAKLVSKSSQFKKICVKISISAIRYISSIRHIPTYFQLASVKCICVKFQQYNFKIERLICVATDEHTDTDT